MKVPKKDLEGTKSLKAALLGAGFKGKFHIHEAGKESVGSDDPEEKYFLKGSVLDLKGDVYEELNDIKFYLNLTNLNALVDLKGDETEDWPANQIPLKTEDVDYMGKRVLGIRISE